MQLTPAFETSRTIRPCVEKQRISTDKVGFHFPRFRLPDDACRAGTQRASFIPMSMKITEILLLQHLLGSDRGLSTKVNGGPGHGQGDRATKLDYCLYR